MQVNLNEARRIIQQANRIVAFTGAGISAESGIPTFRGNEGHWKGHSPAQLASIDGFMEDPSLVWDWYLSRRQQIATCQPNAGHLALANLEENKSDFSLVTQNVDGLHVKAGSKAIVELHGNIWRTHCLSCNYQESHGSQTSQGPFECPDCGDLLRPSVVWFGESLPHGAWEQAVQWTQEAELLMVIGTSAVVYPAASLIPIAKQQGAIIIEVNLEETAASEIADFCLLGPSAIILPQLIKTE